MIESPRLSGLPSAGVAQLRILQTTDLHAQIVPYDYYADRTVEGVGLARTAALVDALRAGADNTVLLDNGDWLQGSALGDYMAYDRGLRDGDLHPIVAAMNALQYDAAAIGNHEFNYGLPFLMAALGRSNFPFVCANALVKKGPDARRDTRLLPPYVMLDRKIRDGAGVYHAIRIGVLGLLPPQIVTWDASVLRGAIQSRDMVETAAALIPEMKEAGADIIVALAHTGIAEAQHYDGMENAARPLARLAGIDALVTGHMHMLFPSPKFAGMVGVDAVRGTIDGTPATMAGTGGSHLGVIDLTLQREGGAWVVLDGQSQVLPIAKADAAGVHPLVKSVPRILNVVRNDHEATLDYMRFAVGQTRAPLHSYFALIKDCPSVQLICEAQRRFMATRLEGTEHAALPLLSAAAPFKVGGWAGPNNYTNIAAGPMYQRSVADMYCFPNTICAVRVSGADIVEWLERSAALFHRVELGKHDQPLLNESFPSYQFDIILGLTYEIDPTQPARYSTAAELQDPKAQRIRNLRYNGDPVDMAAEFIVATNNYRASLNAALSAQRVLQMVYEAPVTIRNILLNEIASASPLDPKPVQNWRLASMPDTSFVFETSPEAVQFLRDLGDVSVEPLGITETGFGQYRLHG
ncbi:bifunctional 2',3'-cyclic-nucleotide 2'-phosphodiesterase/3'-nucleotidase [Pseudorhodobacter sp. W20_MBD10_FR17]|uniref:bifunctional 2',3'-cyclic-nucleotide 2'-phosphodiesterase/3'-nucleotidase n=1 Tax=Pseudorhodobacter sp. W20_MBD10_FR17 TaxID=3240266 RepID=UPI003F95E359